MNQNDIRMFLTIAKIGSLNQAASHLFVTQPALSQQLKSLETELGTTLFLRKQGQRNLTLTASGRGFYEIAVKMDALFQESMQVRYLEDVRSLSIHTVGSLNSHLLNPLYQRLSSMTPPIALKLATGKTHIIYQSIADHSYDIGFVHRDLHRKDLILKPVFREPMILVCGTAFHDPGTPISPQALNPAKELHFSWSIEYDDWHDYWFGNSIPPHIALDQTSTLEFLLTGTDYWAIIPASVFSMFLRQEELHVATLLDPPPSRTCYAIYRKDQDVTPDSTIGLCLGELQTLVHENRWLEDL